MRPTVGRIVHYQVNQSMVDKLRKEAEERGDRGEETWIDIPEVGQDLPMIVISVRSDDIVNGRIFVDGQALFDLWGNDVHKGAVPGTWHWPEISAENE